jgi:hypothetical protein
MTKENNFRLFIFKKLNNFLNDYFIRLWFVLYFQAVNYYLLTLLTDKKIKKGAA